MNKESILPTEAELAQAIREINPLWRDEYWPNLAAVHRYPFHIALNYLNEIGSQRAVFLRGFRGVGKSTLLRQMGTWLRDRQNIEARNIVYIDFEKRPLRQIPWNVWFKVWEKEFKPAQGLVYFLFDEIQYADGWVQEVRSMLIDSRYRIVATGSAAAEIQTALDQEVRRWISLHVPALLFHEYILIYHPNENARLENDILKGQLFFEKGSLDSVQLSRIAEILEAPLRSYILRGGFPELAGAKLSLSQVQRLLMDVVDKALYQDMRNQFSRQDIKNLERLLEYVCRNPGALLDKSKVSETLEVSRPTTARYVKALDDGDFIRLLNNQNKGGKKALKAKPKIYPADASLRNALLGRTEDLFNQPDEMGHVVEGMIATHLDAYAQAEGGQVGYWRKKDNEEVDFRYQRADGKYWVIESKYGQYNPKWISALQQWSKIEKDRVSACFVVCRDVLESNNPVSASGWPLKSKQKNVPASVFLYLLSRELSIKASALDRSKAQTGALYGKAEIEGHDGTTTSNPDINIIKETSGE